MKRFIGISLAIFLASASIFAQTRIPADTIFDNYYKATGGKALWQNIKTYSLKRSYTSATTTPYTSSVAVSMADNSVYKSKTIMNRAFVYTMKGADAWVKVPLGNKVDVKDLSQAEKDAMKYEMYENLVPFIDYQNRGFIATTVGTETINGVATNQVELQGKGVKYNLYFDAKTGLLTRQKETLAGVETVTDFSGYTKSAFGLLYPAKLVEINNVDKKPLSVTSSISINDAVSPELFKR
ncbi:hypothetical protein [Dyadobacter frigoris]|uniref:Salt-induced outer membrane protein n=1 Tax=Dyadobacter frigoris TaxID=2576211 RepID=A0A4U6DAN1_9BACT|nr:hypothetical protein [Dyadobacter frigoris]TKT93471.1 hypothetical protein FDK13_06380 [Dyadobacter frigoris]GLU55803.1 hypothetical protein Dfri01_52640 [Dyadobacter frigoris]